jgi:putative membrane protein
MDPAIRTAIESWSPPYLRICLLLLTAALYMRGFAPLHREMPLRFPTRRLAAFLGGLAAMWLAVASPLEQFDDLLLQVHMIQHLLLMLVAPALLLCGAPAIPLVRALPISLAKSVLAPIYK